MHIRTLTAHSRCHCRGSQIAAQEHLHARQPEVQLLLLLLLPQGRPQAWQLLLVRVQPLLLWLLVHLGMCCLGSC